MTTYTHQQTFDMVVEGFASQGFKISILGDGDCVFRTEDGLKCSVGHLIPDADYRPEFDTEPMGLINVIGEVAVLQLHDFDVLEALQGVHDTADGPFALKQGLQNYAVMNGLSTSTLEKYL